MAFSSLMQLGLNLFLLAGFAIIWMRVSRSQGDDPRMSRSLQLLQSKISILEDLSDRIDEQLAQANGVMEHKKKELDGKIAEVDRMLQVIQVSRDKSLQVAQIFEDKIPHEEIMERQRTRLYVRAAKLAHQGLSVSEIVDLVNLPYAEVDFIAKMNREQLQFSAEELPDWAQVELTGATDSSVPAASDESHSLTIEFPKQMVAVPPATVTSVPPALVTSVPPAPVTSVKQAAVTETMPAEAAAQAVKAFFANELADTAQALEEAPLAESRFSHSAVSSIEISESPRFFEGTMASSTFISDAVKVAEPMLEAVPAPAAPATHVPAAQVRTAARESIVPPISTAAGQARLAKAKLSAKDLQSAITANGKPVVVQRIVFPKLSMNRNLT
jgi:hypothetical protein